jgi:uracil-DNA glycosylase
MTNSEQISLFPDLTPTPETDFERIPETAAVPIPPGTYSSLEAMIPHCQNCFRCDLGRSRTHAVVGRGNLRAPIMVVGEGPGQNEDETGLPFVGKAGQLLEKILASVKLNTTEDVYICNIVKCRPPGNRVPTPEEMAACIPYLLEQIRLVDPQIILLTGATAVKGLTGDKRGITKIRGEWLQWQDRLCMPILHPAYLLRNPSQEKGSPKWLMWQDIQTVKAKLDELRG